MISVYLLLDQQIAYSRLARESSLRRKGIASMFQFVPRHKLSSM